MIDRPREQVPEKALERELAFSELMVRVLSRLGTCPFLEIDGRVVEVLQGISEFVGADHAYVLGFAPDRTSWSATHEWCGPNVARETDRFCEIPFGTLPWSEGRLLANHVVLLNSPDDYPPEAAKEREKSLGAGERSVISVPIRSSTQGVSGCVGVHAHGKAVRWRAEDVVRLRMVADVIGSVLERKRVTEALQRELAFSQLMVRVLSRLGICPSDEIDARVVEALEEISGFLQADHAFLIFVSPDGASWSATHEWCGPNVSPQAQSYQRFPFGMYPWFEKQLLGNEVVLYPSPDEPAPETPVAGREGAPEGWRSVIRVPVRSSSSELLGVLGVHNHARVVIWQPEDSARLRMVGDVIASVLQRQRAETSLRRQNEFLSALQEVTLNLVSEREVEDLLRNILERAVQLTGASGGFIELAERGEAHLSLAVASGVIEEQPVRFSVRAGEGLTGRVWETGRPLTVANYDSWPGRIPDYPRGVIGSIVGVPLVSAGGVSGVVALVYAPSADRTFDPEVVGRLVPFARFAAIALENARAYATARRELVERTRAEASLQRALAFSDVMVRILSRLGSCASEEIDSSVVAALKETATFIGADHAYVIMISPDGTAYRATQEWCGPGVPDFFSRLQHVPFGTLPWSERQILNDEVILANSRDDYPSEAVEERSDALREGCLAVMNVPIRSPLTGVSGAVGVHSRSRSMTWRQEDIVRLRMVADVVGSVLERKRAEASLRESEENYRALSSRLISVEEEAKTSLARELHDGLGQALTALKMDVKWVGQRLASSSAALRDRIDRMNELVDDTIGQVRTVARSLRPALLDDLGLAAAVEWQVSEFGQRTGIETELSVLPGTLSLDGDRSTTVFRILQEALTNVVRHAEARRVRVELKQEGSSVILLVSDDGRGIPDAALADATSLGLIGMKERVRPWNGEIRIDRRPEGGTTVHVRLPVDSLEPRAHGTGEPT